MASQTLTFCSKKNVLKNTRTDQVCNSLHINNVIHYQIIKTARCSNHDLDSLGHNLDLVTPVAPSIDTHTVTDFSTDHFFYGDKM